MATANDVPAASSLAKPSSIVLIAGRVRFDDRVGHHDYLGGCRLLADLLSRRADASPALVDGGWPRDEAVLESAAAILIYDGGGGKQGCLKDEARVAAIDRAVARGCGLVMLHQAVGFPRERVDLGRSWLGGVYAPGTSTRGHWKTSHPVFPEHPVTSGVKPYRLDDGWLTGLVFADGMQGVTPLVWAGSDADASPRQQDIGAWAWERPGGGRSFAYTGIDGHAAWNHEGLRRLVTNALLWTAGLAVAADGADVDIDAKALAGLLTPRASGTQRLAAIARKGLGRLLGEKRRW